MNHELICQWLDLPAGTWPPDYYTLLSLAPREADSQLIEQRIHERMMRIRPYQLTHPDEATEVLNRLAAAFNCLTDPAAKQGYDTSDLSRLSASPRLPPQVEEGTGERKREVIDPADPLAWLFTPWSQLSARPSSNGPAVEKDKITNIEQGTSNDEGKDTTNSLAFEVRYSSFDIGSVFSRKIWSWILQHPGFSLLALGFLALLMALIRHWRR